MAETKTCLCIPVDFIKNHIIRIYRNIKCYDGIHKDSWSGYPCETLEKNICQNDHCSGRISLSIQTPPRDIRILTIFSIRAEERGYAYLDKHLRSLFDKGILNDVPAVKKSLNAPLITSSTKYLRNPPLPRSSFSPKKAK